MKTYLVTYGFGVWFLAGLVVCSVAAADPAVSPDIESALLGRDWARVGELCADREALAASPALRMMKGHACLALNRNNESLLLFLSLAGDQDRQKWLRWTSAFAEANPGAWVAQYLKGDALARVGQWNGALECYNRAVSARGHKALVLNARGVLYATRGDQDRARADFEAACRSGRPFAEAHASLGNLQLMSKASKGALRSYNEALDINPSFALALNGRACAWFGECKWLKANEDLAKAGRLLPLPLFLGNLQGLAVAAENLSAPGTEKSPLFRFTDFLDWETLRDLTMREGDILRTLLAAPLPDVLDGEIIDTLNLALGKPTFYDQVKDRLGSGNASDEMPKLAGQTRDARRRGTPGMGEEELKSIVLLNRLVIERAYPYLIAQHRHRDPGMQLFVRHGQLQHTDKLEYMRGLSDNQLLAGQNRVQNLWRPMADFVQGMSLVSPLGAQWNRHLDTANLAADIVGAEKSLNLQTFRTGGVSSEMRRGFVDRGDWPVVSWFGLAQGSTGLEPLESNP